MTLTLDGSGRQITLTGKDIDSLRLAYAQHVYHQQGATVEHAIVLTGGWQPTRSQSTYKPLAPDTAPTGISRATNSATKDKDPDRITRLAQHMNQIRAHTPSTTYQETPHPAQDPHTTHHAPTS